LTIHRLECYFWWNIVSSVVLGIALIYGFAVGHQSDWETLERRIVLGTFVGLAIGSIIVSVIIKVKLLRISHDAQERQVQSGNPQTFLSHRYCDLAMVDEQSYDELMRSLVKADPTESQISEDRSKISSASAAGQGDV
jgi:hypothetical protein